MSRFDLITVARQLGAGGSELAQSLGRRLGWKVYDREVIRAAAARLDVAYDGAEPLDEYALGALERIGLSCCVGLPELGTAAMPIPIDPDALARAEQAVLRTAARSAPVILVGHGAQCLFRARPRTLHVKVVAPIDLRARRVAERRGIAVDEALAEVRRCDRERERYLRHHFGCDTNEPTLYALQINTAHLSIDDGVAMVGALVGALDAPARADAPPPTIERHA